MKRPVSCFLFLSCLILVTPLYAGTQTLSTYYPAPMGDYLQVTLGEGSAASCTGGNVVLFNVSGVLEVCDKNGTYTLTGDDLWVGNGTYIYPYISTQEVSIGASTNPGYQLYVAGTTAITDIAGSAIIGTNGASPTDTMTVNGNTILGVAGGANTTTINGTQSGTGNLNSYTVSGVILCGSTCGQLGVTQGTDGNWYAVYGP